MHSDDCLQPGPDWTQVSCIDTILSYFLCVEKTQNFQISSSVDPDAQPKLRKCSIDAVLFLQVCFLFKWIDPLQNENQDTCYSLSEKRKLTLFQVLYKTTEVNFPPVLFCSTGQNVQRFQSNRFVNQYIETKDEISVLHASGILICGQKWQSLTIGTNVRLQTDTGGYVSAMPPPQNDLVLSSHTAFSRTTNEHLLKAHPSCSKLVELSMAGICRLHTSGVSSRKVKQSSSSQFYTCPSTQMNISTNLINDLVADCGPQGDDEHILKQNLEHKLSVKCKHLHQISCVQGHPKCYSFSEICTYQLDVFENLYPCRGGNHLTQCVLFQCNIKFKCPSSYCIPWQYVCNSQWDCFLGEDEAIGVCQLQQICKEMFKCRRATNLCIHLGSVCDEVEDCPFMDDEQLCELKNFPCPGDCICLALALQCTEQVQGLNLDHLGKGLPHASISFSQVNTLNVAKFSDIFSAISFLTLHKCNISRIGPHIMTSILILADISFNCISNVCGNVFSSRNMQIKALNFSRNAILAIKPCCFVSATALVSLDLSFNPLHQFIASVFSGPSNLTVLFLENITFSLLEDSTQNDLEFTHFYTTDYQICFLGKRNKCSAKIPWYASQSRILPHKGMLIVSVIFSSVCLLMNLCSIVAHSKSEKLAKSFIPTVIGLNANDCLFVVLLTSVWISYLHFKESYPLNQRAWMSGLMCCFICTLYLAFSMLALLLLPFLSFSRLMVVMYPLKTKLKKTAFVTKVVIVCVLISIIVSVGITFLIKVLNKVISNSICSPFVDPMYRSILTTVLVSLLISWQTLTKVLMIYLNALLVKKFKESQKNIEKSTKSGTKSLQLQMILLPLSAALCWIPMNIKYIMTLVLSKYSLDMIVWGLVVVMPLNSWLYPSIFVIWCVK